jgi:rubredoxin
MTAKKIFCITERSFHYVAAESKEDALKVIEQEDPLHTFDEGYGEVRMLSKSEAEEMGLGEFCEEDTPPEPEKDKLQVMFGYLDKRNDLTLFVAPDQASAKKLQQIAASGVHIDPTDLPSEALRDTTLPGHGIWRVKISDDGSEIESVAHKCSLDDTLLEPEENKYPEPGRCPVCNRLGRLEYDGRSVMEGENLYYSFTCPDCGATGKEWYEIAFDSIEADQKDGNHA